LASGCFRAKHGKNPLAQHIEVVDIAERGLQALEIQTPSLLLLRQKTFDQVTKAFQRNPQTVSGLTAAALAPVAFALASFGEAAQGQPGEMRWRGRNPLGALGQAATPALPALAGKVLQGPVGGTARVTPLYIERTDESGACWSLVEAQAAHPFFYDLRIAQLRQALKQVPAGLA